MLIKIPRVGMQLMIKYPTYAHLPLGFFLYSHVMSTNYQQHVIVGPLINMYINRHIFVLL